VAVLLVTDSMWHGRYYTVYPGSWQKETALMDEFTERAEIDRKLGELDRQRQTAGSDWEKVSQIQERIASLQKRKDKLLGIAE
jgi:hypothetical protein